MKPLPWFEPYRVVIRQAFGVAVIVALATAIASCAISRPGVTKRMFLLQPDNPPAASAPKPVAVRVGVINVAAPFRGKHFVYRTGELKYESDFYNEFFVALTAVLTDATAKSLAAANVYRRVIEPGAASVDEGDFVLDGFVSEFYGDLRDTAKPTAVITVTFYLSTANVVVPSVVWSREYRQRVVASDASPDALARAWNGALTAIVADLARDLAAASLPQR